MIVRLVRADQLAGGSPEWLPRGRRESQAPCRASWSATVATFSQGAASRVLTDGGVRTGLDAPPLERASGFSAVVADL